MLTHNQVRYLVFETIERKLGKAVGPDQTLGEIGLTNADIGPLAEVISVSAATEFGHTVNTAQLAVLTETRIEDLTQQVMQLSAGKFCENPGVAHEQEYPYPSECPVCEFPVRP